MSRPNGSCDVCDAPIGDAQFGPRLCSADPSHDCYSDGFQNGGDPFEPETIKVGHMEQYETVTCRNEDCQNHGTSFVRDDLFQSDDDDAVCPDCGAPLTGQGTPPTKYGVVISERVLVSEDNSELVDLLRHIADQIEQGNVQGFDPTWEII